MSPEDYKVDRWGIFKGKKRHFNVVDIVMT
jgi:hypothetical protein